MSELVNRIRDGDRLALARLLTQLENDPSAALADSNALYRFAGQAHLVGVTGSPGTGKSSLVNRLALELRKDGKKTAVLAVDPTSPFSGGALLGDRVRMREAAQDTGIFIRSMASRGALGGLAHAASAAADVLDGAGYGWVIIETVGAGQTEVDIARLAHSVVVVEAPGLGDDIQAIKAGILEIADILVVNKQDLAGADQTLRSLADMLEARKTGRENEMTWQIPLLGCQATTGAGVEELASAIRRHADYLHETGGWQRRIAARQEKELRELIRARLYEDWFSGLPEDVWKEVLEQLAGHHISPAEAVKKLTGGGVTG